MTFAISFIKTFLIYYPEVLLRAIKKVLINYILNMNQQWLNGSYPKIQELYVFLPHHPKPCAFVWLDTHPLTVWRVGSEIGERFAWEVTETKVAKSCAKFVLN